MQRIHRSLQLSIDRKPYELLEIQEFTCMYLLKHQIFYASQMPKFISSHRLCFSCQTLAVGADLCGVLTPVLTAY